MYRERNCFLAAFELFHESETPPRKGTEIKMRVVNQVFFAMPGPKLCLLHVILELKVRLFLFTSHFLKYPKDREPDGSSGVFSKCSHDALRTKSNL
jgi:hypothetical protein